MSPADRADTAPWRPNWEAPGFDLVEPMTGSVSSVGASDIVIRHPLGRAVAMVCARVVPSAQTLASWLQHGYAASEPGLHNVRMLKVESCEGQMACALFDYGSRVFEGRARLAAVRRGDEATLFVAAAARADFAARLPDLARMLDSARLTPIHGAARRNATDDSSSAASHTALIRLLQTGIDLSDPL
jgi:hypothetical protein